MNPQNTLTTVARVLRRLSRSGRRSPEKIQVLLRDADPDQVRPSAVEGLRAWIRKGTKSFQNLYMVPLFDNGFTEFGIGRDSYRLPANITAALCREFPYFVKPRTTTTTTTGV